MASWGIHNFLRLIRLTDRWSSASIEEAIVSFRQLRPRFDLIPWLWNFSEIRQKNVVLNMKFLKGILQDSPGNTSDRNAVGSFGTLDRTNPISRRAMASSHSFCCSDHVHAKVFRNLNIAMLWLAQNNFTIKIRDMELKNILKRGNGTQIYRTFGNKCLIQSTLLFSPSPPLSFFPHCTRPTRARAVPSFSVPSRWRPKWVIFGPWSLISSLISDDCRRRSDCQVPEAVPLPRLPRALRQRWASPVSATTV